MLENKTAEENFPGSLVEQSSTWIQLSGYSLIDFAPFLSMASPLNRAERPRSGTPLSRSIPNAEMVTRVTDELIRRGCKRRGDWLNGACRFPECHKNDDKHASFGFNTRSGYGFCHVCGTMLLKHLCPALTISL